VTDPADARVEALRRLESLVALLGYWTPLGEVAQAVDLDGPDHPAIRIVLGTDPAVDLKRTPEARPPTV